MHNILFMHFTVGMSQISKILFEKICTQSKQYIHADFSFWPNSFLIFEKMLWSYQSKLLNEINRVFLVANILIKTPFLMIVHTFNYFFMHHIPILAAFEKNNYNIKTAWKIPNIILITSILAMVWNLILSVWHKSRY